MSGAAGQKRVSSRFLRDTRLFLPPRPEQERIAAYLDASCAAIDAAVAAKRSQLINLDTLASSIINRAVTRGCAEQASFASTGVVWFPEIPSNWHVVRFKSLFGLIYRYPTYYNIEYVPEGVPEVRGEALTPDGFIETLPDERYISQETSALFPNTQLEFGDIVMSVRGTMGKIGLVKEKYVGANITANLLRLSPDKNQVTGEFLRWLMRSTYFNEALNSSAPQTTIKTITMPQLAKLRVALPSKSEQHRICTFLEAKLADVKGIASGIETQVATLTSYRKSLIHECVTGRRRIAEEDLNKVKAYG
jgi:type I restriction enzyme S subunit